MQINIDVHLEFSTVQNQISVFCWISHFPHNSLQQTTFAVCILKQSIDSPRKDLMHSPKTIVGFPRQNFLMDQNILETTRAEKSPNIPKICNKAWKTH